jgi:hypothetical protein
LTQAKGRVERQHGVHQDRLIKKLRRKSMASYEAANQYLEQEYLPQHNRRSARAAAEPEDYHRRKPSARELRQIFRLETERTIGNDWVIRHAGRPLQLQPGRRHYGTNRTKALVCEWEDGTMEVHYHGEKIAFTELREPPRNTPAAAAVRAVVARRAKPDHPWRQGYRNMKPRVAVPVLAAPPVVLRTSASP